MSYAPALDAYAFDVAVSFASEDREFVGEVVTRITASNARVFCDSDAATRFRRTGDSLTHSSLKMTGFRSRSRWGNP